MEKSGTVDLGQLLLKPIILASYNKGLIIMIMVMITITMTNTMTMIMMMMMVVAVTLQTFYLRKLELLTAYLGKLNYFRVTDFSLGSLPRGNFTVWRWDTSRKQ